MSLYFIYIFCSHSRKSRDLPVASGNIPSRTPKFSHLDPWPLITQKLAWTHRGMLETELLVEDLNTSQNILSSIGEYWAESNRARDCIDELSSLTLQRLSRNKSTATLRSSITMNRMCSCPNHGQAASQFVHTQDPQENLQRHDLGALRDSSTHVQSNQWQVENGRGSSEFANMFDDFLQGDFHGWSSMSGIDDLISEFFH